MAALRPAAEVFLTFLRLGVSCFGGPIAHLGYFRRTFVQQLGWLDDQTFGEVVALCSLTPGATSSKVGIVIGTLRARALGGLAAWLAFTSPSAALLVAFAYGAPLLHGRATGIVHGLIVVAVAVVASAVLDMGRNLCPDWPRRILALLCAGLTLHLDRALAQILVIVLGAVAGLVLLRAPAAAARSSFDLGISRAAALASAALFVVLIAGLSILAPRDPVLGVFAAFFRAGSLVFGGGHVVLPLLQVQIVPAGWIDTERFLAGYGAAQAVPGPLFTFASYLGTAMRWPLAGPLGAAVTTVAIFLPSFLFTAALAPFWNDVRNSRLWGAALRGINAAVVGLLLAALINPVWVNAIASPLDVVLAAAAFALLRFAHAPPWSVVLFAAVAGWFGI